MPRTTTPNKLTRIAEARGITVRQLVIETLKAEGSIWRAAVALDVNVNAIRARMRQYGLRIERQIKVVSRNGKGNGHAG